jgi:hypothetical protein
MRWEHISKWKKVLGSTIATNMAEWRRLEPRSQDCKCLNIVVNWGILEPRSLTINFDWASNVYLISILIFVTNIIFIQTNKMSSDMT